jgi:hypothetical protein
MKVAIVESVFDAAVREINAFEVRIARHEDDADAALWAQALTVVTQLEAGLSQHHLAARWINSRTGEPYSQMHVSRVKRVVETFKFHTARPRFRDAYNDVANARKDLAVHHASETAEHYTPRHIVGLVVDCLGAIDLDPCSNAGRPNVPAAQHFTEAENGLAQLWDGRVYMNPPYGSEIEAWVEKLCAEYERQPGGVVEAIALVPARPDTQWFKRLACSYPPVCFVEGRLTFVGNVDSAPFPSALFYLGENVGKFYRCFEAIGECWQRMIPGVSFGE